MHFSLVDAISAAFLGYYWTGVEMVLFHSQSEPIDRPGYVRNGFLARTFAGVVWPLVAWPNREFGWFFICFISSTIIIGATLVLLQFFGIPYFWAVMIFGVLRVLPGISAIVSVPLALLASILWLVLAKPLGARLPSGIERAQRARENGA